MTEFEQILSHYLLSIGVTDDPTKKAYSLARQEFPNNQEDIDTFFKDWILNLSMDMGDYQDDLFYSVVERGARVEPYRRQSLSETRLPYRPVCSRLQKEYFKSEFNQTSPTYESRFLDPNRQIVRKPNDGTSEQGRG
jgi:hypothetical protein